MRNLVRLCCALAQLSAGTRAILLLCFGMAPWLSDSAPPLPIPTRLPAVSSFILTSLTPPVNSSGDTSDSEDSRSLVTTHARSTWSSGYVRITSVSIWAAKAAVCVRVVVNSASPPSYSAYMQNFSPATPHAPPTAGASTPAITPSPALFLFGARGQQREPRPAISTPHTTTHDPAIAPAISDANQAAADACMADLHETLLVRKRPLPSSS